MVEEVTVKKDYEGEYVKTANDATFWLIEDGKRVRLNSQADWWAIGFRPLNVIDAEELEAIPYGREYGEEPEVPEEPEPVLEGDDEEED